MQGQESGRVLSCGKTEGVSTYSLIIEVLSTDDVIHPLWPLGLRKPLGKLGWGWKGWRAENLERMTDKNRNQLWVGVGTGCG